jgi:hypothetical protein
MVERSSGVYPMNRRQFVLASGLVAAYPALQHEWTSAQGIDDSTKTTPSAQDREATDGTFADVPGLVQVVFRGFEASQAGFMDILTGGLMIAAGYGAEFERPDDASRAIDILSTTLVDTYLDNVEGTPGNPVEASIGRLGDERLGLATTIALDDDEFYEEIVVGVVLVRKGRFLQVLLGGSTMGPLSQLTQISAAVDARWPSDDAWDIVPELADMPVGMVLDSEEEHAFIIQDRERESTDDDRDEMEIETGALTFSVELRVRGLYLEADESMNTCSGAGFYDVVDAGSAFMVLGNGIDDLLYITTLSSGTLQQSSCAWTVAVLGIPPRAEYVFLVGQKRMGTARFEDIQQGEIARFEKDK